MIDTLRTALLGVVLLAACVCDIRWRRIPNGLTMPALLAALAAAELHIGGLSLGRAVAGIAVASVALTGYAVRALGAGDVKLLWVVGATLGPRMAGVALAGAALAGGLFAVLWIVSRRTTRLPYAPAIAVGTFAALGLAHGGIGP